MRTSRPTVTASSTNAVMRCGVDTERSTPQFSLNSHSFFGWFTRAMTRGTETRDRDEPEHARLTQRRQLLARPLRRDRIVEQADLAARVEPLVRLFLRWQQTAHHLVGRPRDGGDGRYAEALVDERAAGI